MQARVLGALALAGVLSIGAGAALGAVLEDDTVTPVVGQTLAPGANGTFTVEGAGTVTVLRSATGERLTVGSTTVNPGWRRQVVQERGARVEVLFTDGDGERRFVAEVVDGDVEATVVDPADDTEVLASVEENPDGVEVAAEETDDAEPDGPTADDDEPAGASPTDDADPTPAETRTSSAPRPTPTATRTPTSRPTRTPTATPSPTATRTPRPTATPDPPPPPPPPPDPDPTETEPPEPPPPPPPDPDPTETEPPEPPPDPDPDPTTPADRRVSDSSAGGTVVIDVIGGERLALVSAPANAGWTPVVESGGGSSVCVAFTNDETGEVARAGGRLSGGSFSSGC